MEYYNYYCESRSRPRALEDLSGASIRVLPTASYRPVSEPGLPSPRHVADEFLGKPVDLRSEDLDSLLTAKTELERDRIDLLVGLIVQEEAIRDRNLEDLYRGLFTLDKMQKERPFPYNYRQDQIWLKLTEDKLRIYDAIRREIRESAKSLSFLSGPLIDGLIGHKRQRHKEQMLNGLDENR